MKTKFLCALMDGDGNITTVGPFDTLQQAYDFGDVGEKYGETVEAILPHDSGLLNEDMFESETLTPSQYVKIKEEGEED